MSMTSHRPARKTYQHGSLRRVLLDEGMQLARSGGPNAVLLRRAVKRAGVVPSAAYRYFVNRGELLDAVRSAALSTLAAAIETKLAGLYSAGDPADIARESVGVVTLAYLQFAKAEPG